MTFWKTNHTLGTLCLKLFQVAISRTFYNYLKIGTASCNNYNMNKFRETNWCCNFTIFSNISKIALTIDELKSREINSCCKFTKFCGLIWNQIWYIFPNSIRDECYYIESISRCLNIYNIFQWRNFLATWSHINLTCIR